MLIVFSLMKQWREMGNLLVQRYDSFLCSWNLQALNNIIIIGESTFFNEGTTVQRYNKKIMFNFCITAMLQLKKATKLEKKKEKKRCFTQKKQATPNF